MNLCSLLKGSQTVGDVPFLLWASVDSSVKREGSAISLNQVVARIGICGPWVVMETLENIIVSDIIMQERQTRRTQGPSLGTAYKTDVLIPAAQIQQERPWPRPIYLYPWNMQGKSYQKVLTPCASLPVPTMHALRLSFKAPSRQDPK